MSREGKLIRGIDNLIYKDRLEVLKVLINLKVPISEHGDGCRINLDKLSAADMAILEGYYLKLSTLEPVHTIGQ